MMSTSRWVYEFISKITGNPIVSWKHCKWCGDDFPVTQKEKEILDKISPVLDGEKMIIPDPTLCADCRLRRKQLFRNERKFYRRKCDVTWKSMVSVYPQELDNIVTYDADYWNSDQCELKEYGVDVDLSKSIMQQFKTFSQKIPKRILFNSASSVNSQYSNYGANSKDCYMCTGPFHAEKCYYSYLPAKSVGDVDSYFSFGCQYCYECVECSNCYECSFLDYSYDCKFSSFLLDCVNCEKCLGCVNLINKKYYYFNQELSSEEYEKRVKWVFANYDNFVKFKTEYEKFHKQFPRKNFRNVNAENCVGDVIKHSWGCTNAFSCIDIKDCINCFICGVQSSDLLDCTSGGAGSSFVYDAVWFIQAYKSAFTLYSNPGEGSFYLSSCGLSGPWWVNYCFACEGIDHAKYYIFNKEYDRQDWEILVKKMIQKMQADGEWGEFFDPNISPFACNDTPMVDYLPPYKLVYPDGKEEIYDENWRWIVSILEPHKLLSQVELDLWWEEKIKITWRTKDVDVTIPEGLETVLASELPLNIQDVWDGFLKKLVICEETGKPFRIIKQELEYYKTHNLPLPRKHPELRFVNRLKRRAGMGIYLRKCDKCTKDMLSVYPWNSELKVYCEECYGKEVY